MLNLPIAWFGAHRRGKPLVQPPFDHRLSPHQRETQAVVEHRVASAANPVRRQFPGQPGRDVDAA